MEADKRVSELDDVRDGVDERVKSCEHLEEEMRLERVRFEQEIHSLRKDHESKVTTCQQS